MNKTISEALVTLQEWYDKGIVGNIMFFRAPRAGYVGCVLEQTIKAHEMDDLTKSSFLAFMDQLDADKGEFWRDQDGNPDRVKVVKGS